MKTLTLVSAVIVTVGLFIVPSLFERQLEDRFDGRIFPVPQDHGSFETVPLSPAVSGPEAAEPVVDLAIAEPFFREDNNRQPEFAVPQAPSEADPWEFSAPIHDSSHQDETVQDSFSATQQQSPAEPVMPSQQADGIADYTQLVESSSPLLSEATNPQDGETFGAPTEQQQQQQQQQQQPALARIYGSVARSASQNPRVAFNPYTNATNQGENSLQLTRPTAAPRYGASTTDAIGIPAEKAIAPPTKGPALGLTVPSPQSIVSPPPALENTTNSNSPALSIQAEANPEPLPVFPTASVVGEPTLAAPEPIRNTPNDQEIEFERPTSVMSIEPNPRPTAETLPEPATPSPTSNLPATQLGPPATDAVPHQPYQGNAVFTPTPAATTTPVRSSPIQASPIVQQYAADCENCNLGQAWESPDEQSTFTVGGWLSGGYHTASNDLFNNRPDAFALHQGWLYAEKSATDSSPLGFRVDAIYGIDAADTQAFGNNPGTFDFLNGFDFGSYGWALPQAYVELAMGEWTIKAGHFFTLLGYETVAAPDNFFYSHAITMYNSEPFTHTGVVANRQFGDFDVFAGWTLGWDTGFDQFGSGSSWLGGFSYTISDDASFAYYSTAGNLGQRGSDAYSQSVVFDVALTDNLTYVLQSDYLRVGSTGEDNVGINQYATYDLSEQLAIGTRFEWWKGDVLTGYAPHGGTLPTSGSLSYFAATIGLNLQATDTLVVRPEVRHDWSPAANIDQTYFGVDAVWSF